MSRFTFLLIGIFVLISFLFQHSGNTIQNPFFDFFLFEGNVFMHHMFIFSICLIAFAAYQFYSLRNIKNTFFKQIFFSLYQTIALLIISFFLSFVVLCCIAIVQLNILAILLATYPDITGVLTNKSSIATALKKNNLPPKIITTEMNSTNEVTAFTTAITGTENFYGKSIVQSIPHFLIIPINTPASGMLLLDDTLIVTNIIPDELQSISPLVGDLYVKQYFPIRQIKAYPKIKILRHNEYVTYRQDNVIQQIHQIDKQITLIENRISSLSAEVENAGSTPSSNTAHTLPAIKQRLQTQIQQDKSYDDFYKAQKNIMMISIQNSPHELGIFIPNDTINIVINNTNPHAIADYFETVVHEYLHYASYISDEKMLSDSFFEEGLTEYFARQTIKDNLRTSTNLGYPLQEKIINEMTNKIAESDFAEIYFTKDQQTLEYILNRVYGDTFYDDNRLLFQKLQYTSNPRQELVLANEIMKRIGGPVLTIKDVISSYSNL